MRITSIADPGDPGSGEVLLKVVRAGLCGSDASEFAHGPVVIPLLERNPRNGHLGPLVIGHEFVAVVVALGADVTSLEVGQRVVPGAGVYCGQCSWCLADRPNLCASYYTLGMQADGGLAEYVLAPAKICMPVPDECSDDEAAMAQPLAVALHALDRSRVQANDTLLVTGAGGIGGFIIAAAAARGCGTILAIDIAAAQLESAGQFGATRVINAGTENTVDAVLAATDGDGVHVALEASGAPNALADSIRSTRRGGRITIVGLPKASPVIDTADVTLRELELIGTVAHVCDRNIPEALAILAASQVLTTAIDRVVDLEDLVVDGLEPLTRGQVVGKVLVRIGN